MSELFDNKTADYPADARQALIKVRALIFELAEQQSLGKVSETLKWGELSYQAKLGSPIRVDWKSKFPNQIGIYFNCQSSLVETFRELYPDQLAYQSNRAIILPLAKPIDKSVVAHCLSLALRYHSLKHLSLLGA